MERFRQLVEELNRQLNAGARPEHLRQTLALMALELDKELGSTSRSLGTAKVAVVLPSTGLPAVTEDLVPDVPSATVNPTASTEPVSRPDRKKDRSIPKSAPLVLFDEEFVVEPVGPPAKTEPDPLAFNVMEEVPTLYMHRDTELNDRLQVDLPSLNDQLKTVAAERKDSLPVGPVSDLRKAIGVNERFQFIRELFRNDEAMYERSIKTINQFKIFPEADFWINRELKTKLGWPIDHPLVQQFDQLVKRRFS